MGRRRPKHNTAISYENDAWVPVYQAIAWRLSEALPPCEETAIALISVTQSVDLLAFYRDHVRPDVKDETADRRFLRGEVEALDRIAEDWSRRQDARGLRQGLTNLVRQGDLGLHWTALNVLREVLQPTAEWDLLHPEVARLLAEKLGLSHVEERVLVVLYALSQGDELDAALDSVVGRLALRAFAAVCGLSPAELTRVLEAGGQLSRLGLVVHLGSVGKNTVADVMVSSAVASCFSSDSLEELESGVFADERGAGYTLQDFAVAEADKRFLSATLRSQRSVLLYGSPGIGKTEFAYAVGASLGRRVRAVSMQQGSERRGANSRPQVRERLQLVRRAAELADRGRDLLLIDEADALLQGAGGMLSLLTGVSIDKGELNELLDELEVPCVWIANDAGNMPSSSLRRFGYVYQFPRPPQRTRVRMLNERLADRGIEADPARLSRIASRYDLSPSAIDRIVGVVSAARAEDDSGHANKASQRFHDQMEEYLSVTSRGALSRETRKLPAASAHFDPALCNTSQPVERVLARLRGRVQEGKAGRLLFHGPPGGGKTECAMYVAQELGREPVVRRPSDLLSPYVGVAEQNIAEMFRESATDDCVLILDEADALLADRAKAQRSWEVTQAAEFLQGLQNFEGVVIACTNRVESVDPALRRRFHQALEFGPLRPEQLHCALKRLFPAIAWTERAIAKFGSGPPIMASDVATAAEMVERDADAESVVAEIAANARSRDMTRSIGFGTGG